MIVRLTLHSVLLFAFVLLHCIAATAQKGAADIYQDIRKLGVLANVLYVAAHPDDENTRMISYLSNHLHANTTYLSMTRGDGGQNLIGPEIREMLGVIRSHELLEARKIDGGSQLFTRANDFGYSKSPSETFNIWGRDQVLGDVVWAIRKAKPDIIINRFSTDASRPNHGHHTASAILAYEAFDLAAQKTSYPEQLAYADPWQPRRIFWNTSYWFYGSREAFDKADKSKMLALDIGAYDQISGESNSEIAGRSRSMHKSQGFGSAETRGESLDYIDLLKDASGTIPKTLFEGIDISWNRVPGGSKVAEKVAMLGNSFDFKSPKSSIPQLLEIRDAILATRDPYWKQIKLEECESLIQKCLGLFIELRTNEFRVTPASSIPVTLEVINRSDIEASLVSMIYEVMDTVFAFDQNLSYNAGVSKQLNLQVPDHLSIPYWLASAPTEGMYVVDRQQDRGLPADPPAMTAQVLIKVGSHLIPFTIPVIYKTVDPAEGEITKPVYITPPVSVEIKSEALVFNQGEYRTIPVYLTAISDSVQGKVNLIIEGRGWKISPETVEFSFAKSGETETIQCIITPPANVSRAVLKPEIQIGSDRFHHRITAIDYDHLPYMSVVRDASIAMQSLDIKTSHRPIGYIVGAGDDVPASLRQIGYKVDELDPASLSSELLSDYQVVILGVRAFNTIEALSHKNKVLFEWVDRGGTMIVQYNVNRGLVTEDIAPFPITLSRDRISEENGEIHILHPEHAALQYPNKITDSDFNGWVQERGLYFPNKWDENFTPLLEMNDTGENPVQGGLLVAPYGNGYYVYSGLSWFRHLPAGNPGPYRLLSNLISLGYKNNKS